MPLNVSKECFPAPSECHNCLRKRSSLVKRESEANKVYKRCGNCHLMTYCDEYCQREHWTKVHKKHCRFLSGKAPVNGCKHVAATCPRCIDQNRTSLAQIRSENSPKTVCYIEEVIVAMRKSLSFTFEFHGEGKKCHCSLEFACELPFPLGEVSGRYKEIAGTGLDAMLEHALNILTTMVVKVKKEDHRNALILLWKKIICERSLLWHDILVREQPFNRSRGHLSDQVDSLQTIFGASPWWQILKFSVEFVVKTSQELVSIYNDSHCMEDSRFQNLKLIDDYQQSQLRNQAIVCQKQMWGHFMLWPGLVNGSLAILLPPGTRCQSCFAEVTFDSNKTLPSLLLDVSDNGNLMVSCPVNKNPKCGVDCIYKNVINRVRADEDQWKEFLKENELFGIESRDCDFCFKSSLSSHRCSACLTVQYCSTVCQKKDLGFHITVCSTWAKDKSRRILGKERQKHHWKSFFSEGDGR